MVFKQAVLFDTLRQIAYSSIGSSFTAVGTPLTVNGRIICFTNTTDKDVYVSTDGSTNMLRIASGGFKLFDLETNKSSTGDNLMPIGTQFYVAYVAAPSSGEFWIEVIYSNN